jgi:membrane-associated phospholipid phosphatase
MRVARIGTLAVWLAGLWLFPGGAGAQTGSAPEKPSGETSWTSVAVSAAAVAVALPLDGRVRTWIQGAPKQESTWLRQGTELVTPWGTWAPVVVGAGLFGAAELLDHPALADLVWHTAEGTAAASALGLLLKVSVHRTRPYASPDDPSTFFHGPLFPTGSSRQSFPSGHTTVAFAVAAAATEEAGIHWPGHTRALDVALYGLAAGVAFARVYDDVHWTSDVVAGAALGALVGRAVVRRAHRGGEVGGGPPALSLMVLPGGGVGVGCRVVLP